MPIVWFPLYLLQAITHALHILLYLLFPHMAFLYFYISLNPSSFSSSFLIRCQVLNMNELVHYLKTTTIDSALGIETELGIHVNLCCVSFRSFKYNTLLGTQFWLLHESVYAGLQLLLLK